MMRWSREVSFSVPRPAAQQSVDDESAVPIRRFSGDVTGGVESRERNRRGDVKLRFTESPHASVMAV